MKIRYSSLFRPGTSAEPNKIPLLTLRLWFGSTGIRAGKITCNFQVNKYVCELLFSQGLQHTSVCISLEVPLFVLRRNFPSCVPFHYNHYFGLILTNQLQRRLSARDFHSEQKVGFL